MSHVVALHGSSALEPIHQASFITPQRVLLQLSAPNPPCTRPPHSIVSIQCGVIDARVTVPSDTPAPATLNKKSALHSTSSFPWLCLLASCGPSGHVVD